MIGRVAESGRPAFQLRKGEQGLSVFDTHRVEPPLTDAEILGSFRPGCHIVPRSIAEIEAKGLQVAPLLGDEVLPERLREAHCEIRPGPEMTRAEFKRRLQELE
jgi:hypothetical protein